jgi:hypothetical protein
LDCNNYDRAMSETESEDRAAATMKDTTVAEGEESAKDEQSELLMRPGRRRRAAGGWEGC